MPAADFKIHVVLPNKSADLTFSCDDVELASRLCLDLFQTGYTICGITLPGGETIDHEQFEATVRAGLRERVRPKVSRS